jgi:Flp pilus assembly pilin Flp
MNERTDHDPSTDLRVDYALIAAAVAATLCALIYLILT